MQSHRKEHLLKKTPFRFSLPISNAYQRSSSCVPASNGNRAPSIQECSLLTSILSIDSAESADNAKSSKEHLLKKRSFRFSLRISNAYQRVSSCVPARNRNRAPSIQECSLLTSMPQEWFNRCVQQECSPLTSILQQECSLLAAMSQACRKLSVQHECSLLTSMPQECLNLVSTSLHLYAHVP